MRVLIATITAGGGHLQAASALEAAWTASRPGDEVKKVDLLEFFSPLHRKAYTEAYVKVVQHAPELWGMIFKRTDNPSVARKLAKWRTTFPPRSTRKILAFLEEFSPDVVLCTHYLPVEILALYRAKWGDATPLTISVVTDFEAHALWMDPGVDLYCVATDETKARLVARGAAPENVFASGIPVLGKFSEKVDAGKVRQRYGLRDDQPVLLVLSGGFGMGPVSEVMAELDKIDRQFQMVVVAGRNVELRCELAVADRQHPTHVLGFASNMHELMAVADLIVSKPGGLTTSEALAVGRPLFILNPIPGQEAANSDFLLAHGAAAKANAVEDLPYRVGQLLGSPQLAAMARAAKALGLPAAAVEICREVARRASQRAIAAKTPKALKPA